MMSLQKLRHTVGRRSRIVAAHGNEQLHLVVLEKVEIEPLFKVFVSRFETAHLQY